VVHQTADPRAVKTGHRHARRGARRDGAALARLVNDVISMATILCAVDFSECSKQALRWAGALAVRRGSPLIVLHAVDPLLAHAARVRLKADSLDADARHGLQMFAAEAFELWEVQPAHFQPIVVVGDAWRAILRGAFTHEASLIVMGTRGLGGVRRLLLGSTAERVLRTSAVPILLIPEDETRPANTADPTRSVKHVLAATDFGPSSKAAVRLAAGLAGELASDLMLLHVAKPVIVPPQWWHYVDQYDEEQLARARTRLSRVAHDLLSQIPECSFDADLGDPSEAIVKHAREWRAGLIVTGLANRFDFEGARPGAVAYSVVRHSHVPVLVVPRTSELAEQRGAGSSPGAVTAPHIGPTIHAHVV
jgi:nucleotide-binding universal stress UspA family protein